MKWQRFIIWCMALGLVGNAALLYGAPLPRDVETLLDNIEKATRGKTIQIQYMSKEYSQGSAAHFITPREGKIIWTPSGKFICEWKNKEGDFLFKFDGKTLWTHRKDKKLYHARLMAKGGEDLKWRFFYRLFPPFKGELAKVMNGKVDVQIKLEQTQLKIKWRKTGPRERDAYKLFIFIKGNGHKNFPPGQYIYWIDAKTHFPLLVQRISGNLVEEFEITNISLNPSLPNDAFTFKPPQGARKANSEKDLFK